MTVIAMESISKPKYTLLVLADCSVFVFLIEITNPALRSVSRMNRKAHSKISIRSVDFPVIDENGVSDAVPRDKDTNRLRHACEDMCSCREAEGHARKHKEIVLPCLRVWDAAA